MGMPNSVLNGDWTYRSFINHPVPVNGEAQKALQLIFGEGDLSFVFYPRQAAVPTGGS
jgi:hypothetical protein